MAKQDAGPGLKQDEFSKIFDEYRARIEEITRRSEKNLRSISEDPGEKNEHAEVSTASIAITETKPTTQSEENIEVIKAANPILTPNNPPELQVLAENNRSEEIRPDPESYAKIIQDARREAKKIIEEAEESAHKEAKKRTQNQVDKIIDKARREAEEILDKANRNADKLRADSIAESKKEADLALREITQKCRQDAEAQSAQIIAESREKARKMLEDVSISTTMVGRRIAEIAGRAKKTVAELESSLQAEASELANIVVETQGKLEAASKVAKPGSAPETAPKGKPEPAFNAPEERGTPTLSVHLIGEKTPGNNGSGFMFAGQLEMKSVSNDFDYRYLKNLKKYLGHIGHIKYLQEYASEKELSVTFDVLQPIPLLELLKNVPDLDQAVPRGDDYFSLTFKVEQN